MSEFLKAAMLQMDNLKVQCLAGFEVKDKEQLNWHFNVSEKSIK